MEQGDSVATPGLVRDEPVGTQKGLSSVPAYAEIPMRWTFHRSGALLIEVQDARRDFPDFDEVMKWEPAEGERARGLWSAHRLGA
jgi:hypothetical protein